MPTLTAQDRLRFRMVVPGFPAMNIYSRIACVTTALGPVCIATNVNKMLGWDAEVIDENNFRGKEFLVDGFVDHAKLQQFRPAQVIGLYGGLTSTVPRLYTIARKYKEMGLITVAGGQHFMDENIEEAMNNGIDYLVLGEGEDTIRELLAALASNLPVKQIPGLVYREGGITVTTPPRDVLHEFSKYPLPDFSLVRQANIVIYPIERIRGCGMECEFCTVKGKPRAASPERIMEQIVSLVETRKACKFFVVDDLFGQHREETLRFCAMLTEYQELIGKRFDLTVQIRLYKAKDLVLLAAMRKAGITTVAIGLESPVKEDLEGMNKHIRSEEMVELARTYHKLGFLIHGMFIFGYPMEVRVEYPADMLKKRVAAYRKFIRQAKIDTIQVLLPVPLPGTLLRKRLIDQNRIYKNEDIGWEYYDGNFPLFEPDPPFSAEELHVASHKIMGKFYRFNHFYLIGASIFWFPSLVFFLHNLEFGWGRWYRQWRNSLVRSGGWFLMRSWASKFKKGAFPGQLQQARKNLLAQSIASKPAMMR